MDGRRATEIHSAFGVCYCANDVNRQTAPSALQRMLSNDDGLRVETKADVRNADVLLMQAKIRILPTSATFYSSYTYVTEISEDNFSSLQ